MEINYKCYTRFYWSKATSTSKREEPGQEEDADLQKDLVPCNRSIWT